MTSILILLAILAIPLAISAFEAAKPEYDEAEWSDRELQAGFWYRFLVIVSSGLIGVVGALIIVIGILGGGLYWIAGGVAFFVMFFYVRLSVLPALLERSARKHCDEMD